MLRHFTFLLSFLLAMAAINSSSYAQDNQLVKTSFALDRKNDSIVVLHIKATPAAGLQLFTTHRLNADDAFVSTVTLDSSLQKYTGSTDSITETGNLQTVKDANLDATLRYYTSEVTFDLPLHIAASESKTIKGNFSWLGKKGDDFPNGIATFAEVEKTAATEEPSGATAVNSKAESKSPFGIFWISFLAGLAMVFTPCVFPLIPVTVSFFLKKSKNRRSGLKNALSYSISIILIYTIPAFIITLLLGDATLYKISTSVAANILFFLIFVVFAISFFGAFELTLPSKWANSSDEKASKSGFVGIFFMALTLVIVSFSCTGPFVGTLLANVSGSGTKMGAVIGMLGVSAGLALPFSLFAFFPSMLHTLPKSGGWLNSVKVVFGFVELALALKFFSNIDLIYGWRILDREIFLALWIVLALLTGYYLLGRFKMSHDSDLQYVSIPRLFFAMAFFSFAVYLIPGLWGAPLKAMSGLLPPPNTQDFDLNQLQYKIGNAANVPKETTNVHPPKLYTDKIHEAPFGLTTYFDLAEGIAAAKTLNRPIMLDFTGHSCTNCRKMENEVWSNPDVLGRLKNDFVIVSLYTDENSDLPAAQVYTNAKGEKITTLAEKARDYESSKFGMISQPLYMFIDLDEKPLSEEKYGYDPDIQKFIRHLDAVKAEFGKGE